MDLLETFGKQKLQLAVSHRTVAMTPELAIERLSATHLMSVKLDGARALLIYDGTDAQLLSRRGQDLTEKYPEVINAALDLPHAAVLDGELVHIAPDGRFAPWALSQRSNRAADFRQASNIAPCAFAAFDCLWSNWDLRKQPLTERLKHLEALGLSGTLQVVPWSDDGNDLWSRVQELGLEGLVAKRRTSRYTGTRTDAWVKIKTVYRASLIAGSVLPSEHRVLGKFEVFALSDDQLIMLGHVGTGFTEIEVEDLARRVSRYASNPTTVEPVVVDVEYSGTYPSGELRFASFIRIRDDIPWTDCIHDQEGLH